MLAGMNLHEKAYIFGNFSYCVRSTLSLTFCFSLWGREQCIILPQIAPLSKLHDTHAHKRAWYV